MRLAIRAVSATALEPRVGLRRFVLPAALLLCSSLWLVLPARGVAQADPHGVEARALFEQGVQKARQQHWEDAALLFERSQQLVERPATVLNLVLVYEALGEPLQVIVHLHRFFAITDPVRHEHERRQALGIEARAIAKLGRITLSLQPSTTVLRVDRREPVFAAQGQLLLTPGEHRLELTAPGFISIEQTLSSSAGSVGELSVQLRPEPSTSVVLPPGVARTQLSSSEPPGAPRPVVLTVAEQKPRARAVRLTSALSGAAIFASAVVLEGFAIRRANELTSFDPQRAGFLDASDQYTRLRHSVGPLAFAGAALAAGALLFQRLDAPSPAQAPKRRVTATAVGLLSVALLGVGAALCVMTPKQIGSSALHEPTRELGMLALAGGLPGFTWTIGELTR